jgi:hypothetical protein
MSIRNKALKAARVLAGPTVSPDHHERLRGTVERHAQSLSMAEGKHYTPGIISDHFTKDDLRAFPDSVHPWCRVQIGEVAVLLGITHANQDMSNPLGMSVTFDFRGANTPHAVILGFYLDGRPFPSEENIMIAATDATPNHLIDERGMKQMMFGGLLDKIAGLMPAQVEEAQRA